MKSGATRKPEAHSHFATCACGATYFKANCYECSAPEPQAFDLVGYLTQENR